MKEFTSSSGKKSASALKDYYRILLVDDEADILHILKRGLEIKGFKVDAFNSPQDAINTFKPKLYDLAILDIRMPGLNGFALYKQMKKIDPSLTACFLSAFEIHPEEFKMVFPSMSQGIKTIIKKPITVKELKNQITPFLKMSSQARAISGEHILVVYESVSEMIEHALESLKIGVISNEDIMLVTDAMHANSIRSKIAKEWVGVNLENLEKEGRITIHTFQEWYMPHGKFDLQNTIANLREKIQHATEHKRNGFRFVGDMNPFFDMGMINEAMKYEKSLEKNFDLPLIGFCAYTEDRFHLLENSNIQYLCQYHNRVIGATTKK